MTTFRARLSRALAIVRCVLFQEALGCATRRSHGLRGHLQEMRPHMVGELAFQADPLPRGRPFPQEHEM